MPDSAVKTALQVPSALRTERDPSRSRELYIDRLRSVMTALVILHHTAITYGAPGGWFYNELRPSGAVSSLLLTFFVATNQAYFMGFFFLLAGYFTPPSLERKGYARFLGDRFLRLGLPLLVFILVLGPLTDAIVTAYEGKGFWPTFVYLWNHKIIGNGPLWFAQALLIFSIGYCAWRAMAGSPLSQAERTPQAVPGKTWWICSALGVGAAALAIRQVVPTGVNVVGLQLGYFSSYTFLFALGIAAWRYDWLRQLEWKHARAFVIGLFVTWPALPVAIFVSRALHGPGKSNFGGGLSWPAIFYALWEPFVAWGLIAAWLLVFRSYMNRKSAFWAWLNRRAYAVYIIHPPVLVGISLLLHPFVAPALIKFGITGALACVACWLIADPLVRLPGLRRIV
ncbi:MAG TPA: acyltransferase family protein [Terracidiphilus sp.]|nr:acyltransferase family protein [Terracidiphilus sp.]